MENKPSLSNDPTNNLSTKNPNTSEVGGVIVGSAFDFLFEGENKEYDRDYEDYI